MASALCLVGVLQGDPVLNFDFGSVDSPVAKGFVRISEKTRYEPLRKHGWIDASSLKSQHQEGLFPLDALSCDSLKGGGVFVVDIPNGAYRVWVSLGEAHPDTYRISRFLYTSFKIHANGNVKVSEKRNARTYFDEWHTKARDRCYSRMQSVWDRHIRPYFPVYTFPVTVAGAKLKLSFSSNCPVNGLIIYPVSAAREGEREISQFQEYQKQFYRVNYTPKIYARYPALAEAVETDFVPGADETARGYVVFPRYYMDRVNLLTKPRRKDISTKLRVFAARGETEPVSFGVYPLRHMENPDVEVSDLRTEDGAVVSSTNVLVQFQRYIEYAELNNSGKYRIVPYFLSDGRLPQLEPGVPRQYWLTISIPRDAKPGMYRGVVKFSAGGTEPTELSLTLRVLPFTLHEMPASVGMYYDFPHGWDFRPFAGDLEMDKKAWTLYDTHMRDMKAHGFTTYSPYLPRDLFMVKGKSVQFNERSWLALERMLDGYAAVFGKRPISLYVSSTLFQWCLRRSPAADLYGKRSVEFTEEFNHVYATMVRMFYVRLRAKRAEREWPELIFGVSDELSNHGKRGIEYGLKNMAILNQVKKQVPGGFKISCSMNGPGEVAFLPHVDVALANYAWPITEETISKMQEITGVKGFYNCGSNRFAYGYWLWRVGGQYLFQWHYNARPTNTYNFFNFSGNTAVVYVSEDKVWPTLYYEEMREGIDDGRYIATLQLLIAETKKRGGAEETAAAAKAENVLKDLQKNIRVNMSHYRTYGYWHNSVYDKMRWRIAKQIMALQSSLGLR